MYMSEVNDQLENSLVTLGETLTSGSVDKLFAAMSQFTQQVEQPEKKGINNHTKAKYVKLEATVTAIKSGMKDTGLSYLQVPVSNDSFVGVSTIITHSTGQFIKFPAFGFSFKASKPHDVGSYMTYSRRYSLSSAFGLASDEDDDGAGAQTHASNQQAQQAQLPPQVDRAKVLANITDYITEISELSGVKFLEVKDSILLKQGVEDFKFLKGTDLENAEFYVKRQLDRVKTKKLAEQAQENKANKEAPKQS